MLIGKPGPKSLEALDLLQNVGPMGRRELAHMMGVNEITAISYVRSLKQRGLIHVSSWERQPDGHTGNLIPVYKAGPGEDAPKPKARSKREINARYRARHAAMIEVRHRNTRRVALGVWGI